MTEWQKRTQDNHRLVLWSILIAAVCVRVWGISCYYYNPDEMQFLIIAKGDTLSEVWKRGLAELHPPLSQFIRHYLLLLTDNVFVQRLFSVAAGIVSILGLYRFGFLLGGPLLGLACAAYLAFAPAAVSLSMLIRNYAFFMPFLSWALYFFARFEQQGQKRDLKYFAVLMFLACVSHFTAYFVAAACGSCLGWRLLKQKDWGRLWMFSASLLPLFIMSIIFYFYYLAPGTAGPMWSRFVIETGFTPTDYRERISGIPMAVFAYFIPFLGMLDPEATSLPVKVIFILSAIILLCLQVTGIFKMYVRAPRVCCLVIAVWAVALLMAFADKYPFATYRHNYYLIPFFILPYWYTFGEGHITTLFQKRYVVEITSVAVILLAFFLANSGGYLRYSDEFGLKKADYTAAQEYLSSRLKSGDAVVTGKIAAYFYFLYENDAGKTAYNDYADIHYKNSVTVLAAYDPPFSPFSTWHRFHDMLSSRLKDGTVRAGGNVWFVTYGYKNMEIWRILECKPLQSKIANFFSRDGVVIYSIAARTLEPFLRDTRTWERCFADYKPFIVAKTFTALPSPGQVHKQ